MQPLADSEGKRAPPGIGSAHQYPAGGRMFLRNLLFEIEPMAARLHHESLMSLGEVSL